MPSRYKIIGVELDENATDIYKKVKSISGQFLGEERSWELDQSRAIAGIEHNVMELFIVIDDEYHNLTIGISPDGRKFLKTAEDEGTPDKLIEAAAILREK